MLRNRGIIVASLIGVVLLAVEAEAQNVLTNPGFNADVSGWTINGVGASLNHDPAVGNAAAGSLRVDNCGTDDAAVFAQLSQCLDAVTSGLQGAANVTFGADFREGTGTDGVPDCGVAITQFTADNLCTPAAIIPANSTSVDPVIGSFTQSDNLSGIAINVLTLSVLFRATCQCPTDPTPEQFWMDDAFLGVGLVPVELQSFSVD